MITLTLTAPLFELIAHPDRQEAPRSRSVYLGDGTWNEVARELRDRFPELAERVLTSDGTVAPGFLLVVNDQVIPRGTTPAELKIDDELYLIAQMAGG